jgi:hypothetical protein
LTKGSREMEWREKDRWGDGDVCLSEVDTGRWDGLEQRI